MGNIFSEFRILSDHEIVRNGLSTLILILLVLLLRRIALNAVTKLEKSSDIKLELKSHIRMASSIFMILGVLFVWGTELRTLALSLVAIAAAIVIATKELILCVMGGVLKSVSRPFKIGDRIEIDRYRGDVIEHDFLTTTLFEIGPARSTHLHTGRRVCIPNSLFLSNGLINETKRFIYGLHTFVVTLPISVDVGQHQQILLEAAHKVCDEYTVEAQKYLNQLVESDGVEAPNATPRVGVAFNSSTGVDLVVRAPVPSLKSARIEQQILSDYIKLRPTVSS